MKKVSAISLFSGAGGMDIGFKSAGFDVKLAVEIDPACCETLVKNDPDLIVLNKDINNVTGQELLDLAQVKRGEIGVVFGGPPCQSFSLAGKREGLEDSRGKLVFEFVRIVQEIMPLCFVMENVKGMVNWDKGRAIKEILNLMSSPINFNDSKVNYQTQFQIMNAAEYGCPQNRERVFLVGNRVAKKFEFPKPTHGEGADRKPFRTVWDAIGNLPKADAPSKTALRVSNTIKGRIESHGY